MGRGETGLVNKDWNRECSAGQVHETAHSQCSVTDVAPRWHLRSHNQALESQPDGHSEDTAPPKRESLRGKTAFQRSRQRTCPKAKRGPTDPRRQPDLTHPSLSPRPSPPEAEGLFRTKTGPGPRQGAPRQRHESLRSMPLPRSLPGSTLFPDPPPGQDAQHPILPPAPPSSLPSPGAGLL